MIKTVKISDKGQIAIPQIMRERMNLLRGEELLVIQIEGKIILQRTNDAEKRMKDDFADIRLISEKSLEDVCNNSEDDVWSEYLK